MFDKFLNKPIVHDVSFRRLNVSLPLPNIIGNMIAVHSKRQCFLWKPEVWKDVVSVLLIFWRKYKTKGCQIGCTGKI